VATLNDLRYEIDEIDKKLHDLLIRRIGIGREVAEAKGKNSGSNLRPGRESQILYALAKRNVAPLSMKSVVRIWREILSANLNQQIKINAAVFSPNMSFYGLASEYCGTASTLVEHHSPEDVLKAVAAGAAKIGILPGFKHNIDWRWWPKLVNYNHSQKLNIISYIPMYKDEMEGHEAVIIAAQEPEESGNDTTVFVVEGIVDPEIACSIDTLDVGNWNLVLVDGYKERINVPSDINWFRIGVFSNPISAGVVK
jgi:chorismate mutase/prephenate dehydratase